MHKGAPAIESASDIALLHIADATAEALKRQQVHTVGLLGTGFTMDQNFYKGRLTQRHGIEVLVPERDDRRLVHRVIYEELCLGRIEPTSHSEYLRILDALAVQGAQAVILGCTEIGLLVQQRDTPVPLFDTTAIHAAQAVALALTD